MSVNHYEEFKEQMNVAVRLGVIKNLRIEKFGESEHALKRKFIFETPEDLTVTIIWYWNLYTVRLPGMEVWVDKVGFDSCHPSFDGNAMRLSYDGKTVATIGHRRELNW